MATSNTAKRVKRRLTVDQSMAIIKGNEPKVSKDNFKSDLIGALNWYNANWEEKEYRAAAEAYVVKHMKMKDAAYALSKADFLEVRSIGSLGRLIMREQYMDLDYVQRLFERIEALKQKYIKPKAAPVVVKDGAVVPVLSIQERIVQTARDLAGDVEGAIDDYLTDGTEFSMKNFLLSRQVSGVVAKKIGEFYKPLLAELEEAIEGKCPQLKEGYSHYTKRGLKAYAEFIRQIVVDCTQQAVSAKAQRKPRARKAKPASVIVKKMVYMREFPELKLKSITADKIIGATELWVYNTANRKLIWYKAADANCLGVSGMSITNYDVEGSEVKTLRDPAKFFKDLSSTGKRAMASAWKGIRAKTSKPRARINDEMILLAAN